MFGIGIWELIVIAVICVVAVNPKDIPVLLRKAGKWYRELKDLSGSFSNAITNAVTEESEDTEAAEKEPQKKKKKGSAK